MSVQSPPAPVSQDDGEGVLKVKYEPDTDVLLSQADLQPQPQFQPQPSLQTQTQAQPPPVLSEWDLQRARLQEAPYDTNLWNLLIEKAEESGDLEKIKQAYESLLEKYPNAVSYSFPRTAEPSVTIIPHGL